MDSNRIPQRNYRGIRVSGVNAPGVPQLQELSRQSVPEQIDITTDKFTQMNEDVERGYQAALEAVRARGEAKRLELQAKGRSDNFSNLGGLIEAATQAYLRVEDYKQKTQAEQLRLRLEGQEQQIYQAIEQPLQDLTRAIYEGADQQGIDTIRADIDQILQLPEFTSLPAPVQQEVRQYISGEMQTAQRVVSERQYNQVQQLRQDTRAAKLADLRVRGVEYRVALEGARTPEEQVTAINSALTFIRDNTADLPIQDRLIVATDFMGSLEESNLIGARARAETQRVLRGIQRVSGEIQRINDTYGGDPNIWRLAMRALFEEAEIPQLADEIMSNEDIQQRQQQITLANINYTQALTQYQQEQFFRNNPDFTNDTASVLAFSLLQPNGASERARIEALGDKASPLERQALQLYRSWSQASEKHKQDLITLNREQEALETLVRQRDPRTLGDTRYQFDNIEREWVPMPVSSLTQTQAAITSVNGVGRFAGTIRDFLMSSGAIQRDAQGNEVLYVSPSVSAEEVAAKLLTIDTIRSQIQENINRFAGEGVNIQNLSDQTFITPIRERQQRLQQELERIQAEGGGGGSTPSFNSGGDSAPSTPPVQALAQVNGSVVPFKANQEVVVTDRYEPRHHRERGRPHHGIDLVGTGGGNVPVLTVQGGTVIRASQWGDYGGTVLIRTPDGRVEQYSHLRSFNVRVGQSVPPGTDLGLMGGGRNDPMAGTSSGRHLHFQVWKPDPDFGNPTRDTISPWDYLNSIRYNQSRPDGLGLPPQQGSGVGTRPIAFIEQTPTGAWVVAPPRANSPSVVVDNDSRTTTPTTQVYTPGNPRRNAMAPIQRGAYPRRTNPDWNYGYSVIARDREFAAAIAELANHLNIPGQWLADVMAYEVGADFNPHRAGGDDNKYHGLIQISEDNLDSIGITLTQLRRMSRAEYVRRVAKPYFEEFRGRINTIEDLYAAILGGTNLFRASPQQRGSRGDSNGEFQWHVRRIGRHVGRRYRTTYDGNLTSSLPVHTEPTANCPLCTSQGQTIGQIIPHQEVIA